jgi:TetR/AcrR family transcriptional regulator, cholesterol catabolism regulator
MARPRGHGPQYEVRRQEIIRIAARLFAQRSYGRTSLDDLCAAVGLGRGALYHYIGAKEQLLLDIPAAVVKPLTCRAQAIVALPGSAPARLRLVSELLLRTIFSERDLVVVYEHDQGHLTGVRRQRFVADRAEFERIITALIGECVAEGSFTLDDPHLAMLEFLNLHNHTYQWVNPRGRWSAPFLSERYCAVLFAGFGLRSPRLEAVEREVVQLLADHAVDLPEVVAVPGALRDVG